MVIADWRQHYNRERPHSRLGYLSPEDFIQTKILTPQPGQLLGPAHDVKAIYRDHGISEATYYNWKSKYGGTDASNIERLQELENQNRRFK